MVKSHQTLIGKTVVNLTTLQRWYAEGELHKMTAPLRQQVSRARKKRAARIANRKARKEAARAEWLARQELTNESE